MHVTHRSGGVELVFGAPRDTASWTTLAAASAWMDSTPTGDDLERLAGELARALVSSTGLVDEDDDEVELEGWPVHARAVVLSEEMSAQDIVDVAREVAALVELPLDELQELRAWVYAQACGCHVPRISRRMRHLYALASMGPQTWDAPPWAAQVLQYAGLGRTEGHLWRLDNPHAPRGGSGGDVQAWQTPEHHEGNQQLRDMISELR